MGWDFVPGRSSSALGAAPLSSVGRSYGADDTSVQLTLSERKYVL